MIECVLSIKQVCQLTRIIYINEIKSPNSSGHYVSLPPPPPKVNSPNSSGHDVEHDPVPRPGDARGGVNSSQ